MLPKIAQHPSPAGKTVLGKATHLLVVLPFVKELNKLGAFPGADILPGLLARRGMKAIELAKTPLSGDLAHGGMAVWVMLDQTMSRFERQTRMRKALQPMLAEHPKEIVVAVSGTGSERRLAAETAVQAALLNGVRLPTRKQKDQGKPLQKLTVHGYESPDGFAMLQAE